MKRIHLLFFALVGFFLWTQPTEAHASDERQISFAELPSTAQTFMKRYFDKAQISRIFVEDEFESDQEFKVYMVGGDEVEFDAMGDWKEVKTIERPLPEGIVPQPIRAFVAQRYPEAKAHKISRDRRGYEVDLDNGYELEFNRQFKLREVDR